MVSVGYLAKKTVDPRLFWHHRFRDMFLRRLVAARSKFNSNFLKMARKPENLTIIMRAAKVFVRYLANTTDDPLFFLHYLFHNKFLRRLMPATLKSCGEIFHKVEKTGVIWWHNNLTLTYWMKKGAGTGQSRDRPGIDPG